MGPPAASMGPPAAAWAARGADLREIIPLGPPGGLSLALRPGDGMITFLDCFVYEESKGSGPVPI